MTSFVEPLMNCDTETSPSITGMKGRIFNIQRYSLHDGTGIRTVVFFKGCPLRCPWCANPESRSPRTTYIRRESKCINCETCAMDSEECPSGAWEQVGEDMTLEEVISEVNKDDVFFNTSNGGITLSGGEVLAQPYFAIELLSKLKALGYKTAIETSGHGSTRPLLRIGELCDEILFDFKIMDPVKAKQVIGINLELVLKNFRQLMEQGSNVIPRLPLIPGYTLDLVNVDKVLQFLKPFNLEEIHLLPFHQYGANKYQSLGMEYLLENVPVPGKAEIESIRQHIMNQGYQVTVGG